MSPCSQFFGRCTQKWDCQVLHTRVCVCVCARTHAPAGSCHTVFLQWQHLLRPHPVLRASAFRRIQPMDERWYLVFLFLFLKYILLIMLLQLAFFSLLYSSPYIYLLFGFSISHTILTILNLPLSVFYLPFMLLVPCTFSSIFPLAFPTDNPLCDLNFCDSVPVLVVCLVYVLGFFFLGSFVDSCEFVVILLFIVLIIFFLDKSLLTFRIIQIW